MPMRLSGLVTGMDTEAIVAQMMSAQSLKKTRVVQKKTKLEWKKEAWTDLNKKLTGLYNTQISKMRLPSSYNVKKVNVSDPTKASVSAGTAAVNGNYSLKIDQVASSQYLTGAKTRFTSGSDKLTDSVVGDPNLLNKTIHISTESGDTDIDITADTTVNDFVKKLKEAGLNANYDTVQQRFFISSKDTGAKQAFSISTASISSQEMTARNNLKNAIDYDNLLAEDKTRADEAIKMLRKTGVTEDDIQEAWSNLAKSSYHTKDAKATEGATNYVKALLYDEKYQDNITAAKESLKSEYYKDDGTLKEGKTADAYEAAVRTKADTDTLKYVNENIASKQDDVDLFKSTGVSSTTIESLSEEAKAKFYSSGTDGFTGLSGITESSIKSDIETTVRAYAGVSNRTDALLAGDKGLSRLGIADMSYSIDAATGEVSYDYDESVGMALVGAKDSVIELNGAKLTSSSTTVTANGLSINAASSTAGETISFTVNTDTDAVYDSVKKMLSEYNAVMKEMNTYLNAESSKGYEPLTSDEKKAMSEDEVKEWEKKIKDSLLRRDSTLSGIVSSMRDAMMSTATVNGKTYALSSFGIMTSTDYTEGGLLHIYGDSDDAVYAGEEDRLKKALTENPEETVEALSSIIEKLRSTMFNKMKATEYSSALTFYDDKQMDKDIKDYKSEIKTWEDKLAEIEDSYFKKFTAMESAMAKLQAQQSSLGGLLGMG